MAVIAERPTAAPRLGLPPGSVPEPVRAAIRGYRAGVSSAERLIAVVDQHGDALEREIARKAVQNMADLQRAANRAEVLAGYVAMRLAQPNGWRRFPGGPTRRRSR
jgi:hypothetical protein